MVVSTRDVARGIAFAVWSWVVFAGLLSVAVSRYVAQQSVTVVDPMEGTSQIPAGTVSAVDVFVDVVTFRFGPSVVTRQPAIEIAATNLGTAAPVVLVALALAAVVALAVRRGDDRIATAFGTTSVLPALVVLLAIPLVFGPGTFPAGGGDESLTATVVAGAVLAVPLAGAGVRVRHRDPEDWAVDVWLHAGWLVPALFTAGYVLGIGPGRGMWFGALRQGDPTLFAATTALLALPFVAATAVRIATVTGDDPTDRRAAVSTDGGVATARETIRESRRATAGLTAFGLVLAVGVVGSAVTSLPETFDRTTAGLVLVPLGDVAIAALLALVIGTGVGAGLGYLATRGERAGTATRFVAAPFATIPLPLLAAPVAVATGGFPGAITMGVLGGVTVAPFVHGRVRRALAAGDAFGTALVAGGGVAATGAAILAPVAVDLAYAGLPVGSLNTTLALGFGMPAILVVALVATVPVAGPLLFVGNGLRD